LKAVPLSENLLLAPIENLVKGALVLICIGLALISGLPVAAFGWVSHQPLTDLAAGIVAGIVTQFIAGLITPWAIARFGKGIYSIAVIKNIYPRNRREWLLAPAAMFLAVVLEELLFRSLLLGGFGTFIPPALLIVAGAAIFGVMHTAQGQ